MTAAFAVWCVLVMVTTITWLTFCYRTADREMVEAPTIQDIGHAAERWEFRMWVGCGVAMLAVWAPLLIAKAMGL